ncbi:MAG: MFS transporter [Chloroflexi bacterium]|nr:MFS transporter [Chloroflexota bacterium]
MTTRMVRRPKIFYGWYIAAAGFLSQFMFGVLMFHSFGTYVALMQADFGWSRTTFSFAFAAQRIESGVLGPIQGWVIDTYGPRKVMIIGLVLFSLGFILLSRVESLPLFYISFTLIAIGSSLGSFLSVLVAIVNWFRRRRVLATGILTMGFAVGGLTATPMALLIEGIGWRDAAFASGIVGLVVGLPIAAVVRHRPEPYGMLPDGVDSASQVAGEAEQIEWSMTAREALTTSAFWFLALGQSSALLVIGSLMVHLVIYIHEDLGYALGLAALAVTIQTLGQIVGQLLATLFGDRVPKRPFVILALLGHSAAMLLLALAEGLPMIYVAVVINGMAWGSRGPLMMGLRADYFGPRRFGTIMGFSSLVIMLGMIIGPIFAGVMYDQTGSYRTGFIVLALVAALGSVMFLMVRPPPERERWLAEAERMAASRSA